MHYGKEEYEKEQMLRRSLEKQNLENYLLQFDPIIVYE